MSAGRIVGFLFLALILFLGAYTFKSFTPPIFSENSVASLRKIDVNGDQQYILIRGNDTNAPVLLFLHGGPGMPAMYLAHDFQRELEKDFTVVHWDQRNAGKSYRKDTNPSTMTVSQLLDDTKLVADYLKRELNTEKLWIAGHSHGSYLGVLFAQRYPDDVAAFIGIGQVTDPAKEVALQDEFLASQLSALGLPADTEITGANREDLLFQTGSEIYGETSFMPLIYSGLKAMEYNLFDIMNVAKGSSFSSKHMKYDVIGGALGEAQMNFDMPVAIIMGKYDMTTPTPLARDYYTSINAPNKYWAEFDQSAHFPFFEEPEKFAAELKKLKTEITGTAAE